MTAKEIAILKQRIEAYERNLPNYLEKAKTDVENSEEPYAAYYRCQGGLAALQVFAQYIGADVFSADKSYQANSFKKLSADIAEKTCSSISPKILQMIAAQSYPAAEGDDKL